MQVHHAQQEDGIHCGARLHHGGVPGRPVSLAVAALRAVALQNNTVTVTGRACHSGQLVLPQWSACPARVVDLFCQSGQLVAIASTA